MKLFINANIYKQNNNAFITENDTFKEFGMYESLKNKYQYDEVIDLNNGYVYPGFNDSHMHLLNLGIFLYNISLYQHTSSIEDLKTYLKEEIKKYPQGSFIRGRGYNQDYFSEKRMLTRSDLDEVSKDIPMVMTRACGHIGVVNSKAIEVLGIKADEKVEMGTFNLETGIFEEFALNMIYERIPKPNREQLKEYILRGLKHVNSYGVTSCQTDDFETCPGVDYKEVIAAYEELIAEGKMTARVNEQCQFPTLDGLKRFIEDGYPQKLQNNLLKMGPLKILSDGSLGARTAYMSEEYNDAKGERGTLIYKDQEIYDLIKYAYDHGMGSAIHCIGDGAIDQVLTAYKKVLKDDPTNKLNLGIVHTQITRADQVKDIIDYKIATLIQSIFIDYDSKIVYDRVDKETADTSYAFKTYYDNGVLISNGSDSPVEEPDVLRGMECAITRCSVGYDTPYVLKEALSVDEAINTYTINGAKVSFEDNIKGYLKENYLADFVVLEKAIDSVDKKDIHNIKILNTYLGAKRVY